MASGVLENSSETKRLLGSVASGQSDGWEALLRRHRERLRRMVSLRLDRRMRGWVDPSDVIRQAFADAAARQAEYLQSATEPFFIWLRRVVGQKLRRVQEDRLGETLPDRGRELSLHQGAAPAANSVALAAQLLGQAPPLSEGEVRAQRMIRLEEALNNMDAQEREILALRHFEQLNNGEAAAVLEISQSDASKLYLRALKKLKEIIQSLSGPREQRP